MLNTPNEPQRSDRHQLRGRLKTGFWLSVLLLASGVCWLTSLPPYYRTGRILDLLAEPGETGTDPLLKPRTLAFDPSAVPNALAELRSRALLEAAVRRSGICFGAVNEAIERPPATLRSVVDDLRSRIEVQQMRGPALVYLYVHGEHPDEDARVAKAIAETYLEPRLAKLMASIDRERAAGYPVDVPLVVSEEIDRELSPHPQVAWATGVAGAGALLASLSGISLSRMRTTPR